MEDVLVKWTECGAQPVPFVFVKFTVGCMPTEIKLIYLTESTHPLVVVTTSDTEYIPGTEYKCDGLNSVEVFPSPKSQRQVATLAFVLMNEMDKGAQPLSELEVKLTQ